MSKILLIDGQRAIPLNRTRFTEEGKLQDYLEQYPNLIPLEDIVEGASDLLCIGREVIAGLGSIDLLCIDRDGLLTIIETKLRRNPEARREVIGQIIEYASYVSQWSAQDIYRIANAYFLKSAKVPTDYRNRTIDDIMSDIVGVEFSEEEFRVNIGQKLRDGKIRLVIAVDELVEQLRATITFLNSYSSFDILLLQVTDFEESETKKVLVPSLFGYAAKSTTGADSRQRGIWDAPSFEDDTKKKSESEQAQAILTLYEFASKNADAISWGTSPSFASFTFRKSINGKLVSVFQVDSKGTGYICFPDLKGSGISQPLIQDFIKKLNQIPGFNIPSDDIDNLKYPTVYTRNLVKGEAQNILKEAILSLLENESLPK